MSICPSQYANTEKYIWNALKKLGFIDAIVAGIMANIYHESEFNAAAYNPNDEGDSAAGLCQWRSDRRDAMIAWCGGGNVWKTNIDGQFSYLTYELKNSDGCYRDNYNWFKNKYTTNNANTARQVAYQFAYRFERCSDPSARQSKGAEYFNEYAGQGQSTTMANSIVEVAKSKVGCSYEKGGKGPQTFDSLGFVRYCYREGGAINIGSDADTLESFYDNELQSKSISSPGAGDIVVVRRNTSGNAISHIGIAVSSSEFYYISDSGNTSKVTHKTGDNTRNKTFFRVLSEAERESEYTYSGDISSGDGSDIYTNMTQKEYVEDFDSLSLIGLYENEIASNLERVEEANYDYGYLIDLTHEEGSMEGNSFKFYIPEFTETAGANWDDVSIIGRSVSVKAYNNTGSRSITIDLELYASSGLYVGDDPVGQMHKDLFFVKSLEYPDYSASIVRPPATVQLILGSAINLVGVVTGVAVQHLKPLDEQHRSMHAKLSFTVMQISNNPPDYRDIRRGKYVLV